MGMRVPPQGQAAPVEAEGQGVGSGGGGGIGEMINTLGQGLTMLVEGLGKAGAPPEITEPFSAALEAFTAGAQALSGGGQPPAQGAAPMEAGAANAAPAGDMRMRG